MSYLEFTVLIYLIISYRARTDQFYSASIIYLLDKALIDRNSIGVQHEYFSNYSKQS